MIFDDAEVTLILREHVSKTFGIPMDSLGRVDFLVSKNLQGDGFSFRGADIYLDTLDAKPKGLGPYRTSGK